MRGVLRDAAGVTLAYVSLVWLVLALARGPIAALFGLHGVAADLFGFFCQVGGAIWFFNGLLFLGNAAFNNLGFPLRSTLLNWGRATLGTIPPGLIGASLYGPRGVVAGMGLGSLLFGVLGFLLARRTVDRLEGAGPNRLPTTGTPETPHRAAPLPVGHAHPGPWAEGDGRAALSTSKTVGTGISPRNGSRCSPRAVRPGQDPGVMFNPLEMFQAQGEAGSRPWGSNSA